MISAVRDIVADGLEIASSAMEAAKEDVEQQADDRSADRGRQLRDPAGREGAREAHPRGAVEATRGVQPDASGRVGARQLPVERSRNGQRTSPSWPSSASELGGRHSDLSLPRHGVPDLPQRRAAEVPGAVRPRGALRLPRGDGLRLRDQPARRRQRRADGRFLTQIVKERSLGQIIDGEPVPGSRGLAGPLGQMAANFDVLKGQLGFNNPQIETNRFSLPRGDVPAARRNGRGGCGLAHAAGRTSTGSTTSGRFRSSGAHCKPFAPEERRTAAGPGDSVRDDRHVRPQLLRLAARAGRQRLRRQPLRDQGPRRSASGSRTTTACRSRTRRASTSSRSERTSCARRSDDLFATREWQVVDQVLPVPFPLGARISTIPPGFRGTTRSRRPSARSAGSRRSARTTRRTSRTSIRAKPTRQPPGGPVGVEPEVAAHHSRRNAPERRRRRARHAAFTASSFPAAAANATATASTMFWFFFMTYAYSGI